MIPSLWWFDLTRLRSHDLLIFPRFPHPAAAPTPLAFITYAKIICPFPVLPSTSPTSNLHYQLKTPFAGGSTSLVSEVQYVDVLQNDLSFRLLHNFGWPKLICLISTVSAVDLLLSCHSYAQRKALWIPRPRISFHFHCAQKGTGCKENQGNPLPSQEDTTVPMHIHTWMKAATSPKFKAQSAIIKRNLTGNKPVLSRDDCVSSKRSLAHRSCL